MTAVELDDHAAQLLDQYGRAVDAITEWEALRAKARDQLMDWLALRDADGGAINGEQAVTLVTAHRDTFDTTRFRAEEPALYQAYLRPTTVRSLRLRGRR